MPTCSDLRRVLMLVKLAIPKVHIFTVLWLFRDCFATVLD